MNEEKELELRMYFLVPYNILDIQKGIQAGHASLEYVVKHGESELFKRFIRDYKTWIILNGGTTNLNNGDLNNALEKIIEFNGVNYNDPINYATFYEEDLNNALTAICFICDERVWNVDDYSLEEHELNVNDNGSVCLKNTHPPKIQFLRELINDKKLA